MRTAFDSTRRKLPRLWRDGFWLSPWCWRVMVGGAARNCGMDRQTLRDWVIRYNEQGIAGLSDRPHGGGARAKLSVEEKAQLAA
jgi:Winged helix-turn helix